MSTKADLKVALRAICVVPQAYNDQGPQFIIDEMVRRAKQALDGEFNGVAASCVHCHQSGERR